MQTRVSTLAEHVVIVDAVGRPAGTLPKVAAHTTDTPLHLAFSCHAVRTDGSVLLTQRARSKRTWPGVWSNACCGHPQAGESLREAVCRRLDQELGLRVVRLSIALPDFAYRAEMLDGTVEHELCPVVVAEVEGDVAPDPGEVDDLRWVSWDDLCRRAACSPESLSPWSALQLEQLVDAGWSPGRWLDGRWGPTPEALLDRPVATIGQQPDESFPRFGVRALDAVGARLRPVLGRFLAEKRAELVAIDPVLADVASEIEGLVDAGGKRLRPAFVYWGHRATGAAHDDAVLHAAGAMELLHTFALIHDDVMDRSDRRRGRASAHRSLAAGHRDAGRIGDGEWFGTSAAVLAGDLAFVWADEMLDGTPVAPGAVGRARRVFTEMRKEVMAGQYLDLVLSSSPVGLERDARQVALLKSARYTVTRPLQLGAALAAVEPDERTIAALEVFGDAVGVAFQLRDDVLGLFGDPSATGKSDLDDLRGGKRTLLMLRALRLASPVQRQVLQGALGDPLLDERGADRVRDVVAATGALASIEMLLAAQHAIAAEALDGIPEPARRALGELAAEAIRRER